MSTTVPIQELDTSSNPPKDSAISAVVTLLWPYSSSTRQCALLLSERDFRLRARGGQIRVKFSGPAARAIAEKRLGIGDNVVLQLGSGEWVRDESGVAVKVPGRSVGELQFGRGVRLRVQKDGEDDVEVNVAEDAADEVEEERAQEVQTPPAKRSSPSASNFRSSFGGTPASAAIYSSPAFMRKSAKFNYLDGISRLFEEEWENQDLPRKKARTSIGEVRDWKIVDRTPSPEPSPLKDVIGNEDEEMDEGDQDKESDIDQTAQTNAAVPTVISPRPVHEQGTTATSAQADSKEVDHTTNMSTPMIHVPESSVAQAENAIPSPPQLQLPPVSPTPVQRQPEGSLKNLPDPATPRLLPLSSATLPSTTPQISPLATKNTLGVHSNNEGFRVVESTQKEGATDTDAAADLKEHMPTSSEEAAVDFDDRNDLADNTSNPAVELSVVVDESEHASSDEDAIEALSPDQAAQQIAEANLGGHIRPDELMADYDEDEDDDMIMHEDDAEDVFDADALDGEDPGDDESDDDVEGLEIDGEGEQRPEEDEDINESDAEGEEVLEVQDTAEVQMASQPKEITPEQEELQQPNFVPASTLLQSYEKPIEKPPSTATAERAAATTPPRPSFSFDGTVASTEVTPAAKTTDTPKTTPQSARDRVMKKTLKSLFGLKGTPSPEKEDFSAENSTVEDSAMAKEEPEAVGFAQDAVVESAGLGSAHAPETTTFQETEERQPRPPTVEAKGSTQEPAELIQLDSSSEEEDEIQQGTVETENIDHTPSKPAVPPPVPQKRRTSRTIAADKPAQHEIEVKRSASVEAYRIIEPEASQEEMPGPPVQSLATGPSQESLNLHEQELEAAPPQPIVLEDPQATEMEPQEQQSMEIFEGLEDIPGQDVGMDLQMYAQEAHLSMPELPQAKPAAENLTVEPEITATERVQEADVELTNITEPKVADEEMEDAQPDEPTTIADSKDEAMDLLDSQEQRASSPASFQSQILDNGNDAQEVLEIDGESRPVSRDTMEDFSPVALGSLSKRVSDIVSDEAAAERLQELESGDVEVKGTTLQAPDVVSRLPGEEQDKDKMLARSNEHEQTPSRVAKQTTVIDLESSPSGLEEFSPVKFIQTSVVEGVSSQQNDEEVDKVMVDEDAQGLESDSEADAEARDRQLRSDTIDESPVHVAEEVAQAESEQRNQQLMEIDELPLTPSLTQSAKAEARLPRADEQAQAAMQPTPSASQPQQEAQSPSKETEVLGLEISQLQEQLQDNPTMSPAQPPPKTPARKSLRSRLSNVPDVISAWFSPKRSSIAVQETEKTEVEQRSPAETAEKAPTPRVHTDGLSTAHSYFASLSNLDQHLNPSSQQAHNTTGVVDILAVVTNSTKQPQRAKGGPRDYYTIFQISDPSLPPSSRVRVEVFRPWKAVLPAADVGDVVLLRAFAVKSRKRTAYLLSTDASGWCVWRFVEHSKSDVNVDNENENETETEKPVWARRASNSDVREEVKGPPVEYGSAEKAQARKLRAWWLAGLSEVSGGQAEDGLEGDSSAVEI